MVFLLCIVKAEPLVVGANHGLCGAATATVGGPTATRVGNTQPTNRVMPNVGWGVGVGARRLGMKILSLGRSEAAWRLALG